MSLGALANNERCNRTAIYAISEQAINIKIEFLAPNTQYAIYLALGNKKEMFKDIGEEVKSINFMTESNDK